MLLSVVFLVLGGVFSILSGVYGLRAAGDSAKAGPAVVFGLLSLIFAVISLLLDFDTKQILACIVPLLYFICALQIKNGKA